MRNLTELLNEFGLCDCCKEQGGIRNEQYSCDRCTDHCPIPCCGTEADTERALGKMTVRIRMLADRYQRDPEFWAILFGEQ